MLYVICRIGLSRVETTHGWHVGESRPTTFSMVALEHPDTYYVVQADGDELAHIVEGSDLPFPIHADQNGPVSWFGDDAKFIIANLLGWQKVG